MLIQVCDYLLGIQQRHLSLCHLIKPNITQVPASLQCEKWRWRRVMFQLCYFGRASI